MKKIILFADTGIDDAITIIYALQNPKIDLIGVVSGYGNVDRYKTFRNASYLLQLGGRSDIPVIAGAMRPLNGDEPEFFPTIHGSEGLGPIRPPLSESRFRFRTNFSKLFQLIKENHDDVTIVNVGRCTSLAIAWILAPDVMALVKDYYVMGGAFQVPGNATPMAEANFYGDAVAANFVMQHAPNLTVIPLNVTREALITPALVEIINASQTSQLGKLIKPMLDYYYEAYQSLEPGIKGSPAHDLLALMAAVDDSNMLRYIRRTGSVEFESRHADGLSIADLRPASVNCFGSNCPRIAVELNYKKFVSNLLTTLT
ncbi:nucleoside hydrolase [Metabacillus iocasae]|uniref:Purine nucleosidase n=1 Tax=Priestia iocasae TaxID=2291674 RepID=A0ABS2QWP2_9BACI|nr:nucleoside hydrolase [Metabacillus iocasae]MBM7703905.1 purine nucleosidase [Metabacillus iocasae]